MSLSKLWKWYEKLIIKYSDTNLKSWYALFLCIIPFIILNYSIFYFIFNYNVSYSHFMLIGLSIPLGRILHVYVEIKYKIFFNSNRSVFILILFLFGMIISSMGLTYLIIKDINGGFPKKEPQSYTKEINPNLLNNPNKYDYLKVK